MDSFDLNRFQRCVKVFANSVAALAEIEAMKQANEQQRRNDYADAYGEESFYAVIERYNLGVDATQQYLFD